MTSLEESRGLRESVLEAPSQLVKKQNDFIQRNIHQLTVELDAIRSGTQKNKHAKDEQLSISGAPIDRKAWMEWFSWPENEQQFMQHSVNCRNGIRKVHNHRLEGSDDLNTKTPRLQPVSVAPALTSFRHLASGCYSIAEPDEAPSKKRMAILLISVSNQTWGMELHMAAGDNGFIIPLQVSRKDSLQPLKVFLPKCLHRNVSIFKMEMQIAEQTTFLQGSCEKNDIDASSREESIGRNEGGRSI